MLLDMFKRIFRKIIGSPKLSVAQKEKGWRLFKELIGVIAEKGAEGLANGTVHNRSTR